MSEKKLNKKQIIIAVICIIAAVAVAVGIAVSRQSKTEDKYKDKVVTQTVTNENGEPVTNENGEVVTEIITTQPGSLTTKKGQGGAANAGNNTTNSAKKAPKGSTKAYAVTDKKGDFVTNENGGLVTEIYDDQGNTVTQKPTESTAKPSEKPSTKPTEKDTTDPGEKYELALTVYLPKSPTGKDYSDTLVITVNGKSAEKVKVTLKADTSSVDLKLKDVSGEIKVGASLVDYGESAEKIIDVKNNKQSLILQISTVDKNTTKKNGVIQIEGIDD